MISERHFSTTFTSFWSEVTPLAESFVRAMNIAADRFDVPMKSDVSVILNGFINELGFRIAENISPTGAAGADAVLAEKNYRDTETYFRRLRRAGTPHSDDERQRAVCDAIDLANRLLAVIRARKGARDVVFHPSFRGCGVHDDCEGDLLVGKELWEVKSGDRNFRQTDVRQLLTYCALNHAAKSHVITDYRFVNPRTGVIFGGSLHDLVRTVAACEPEILYGEIIEFLSHPEVST